MGKISDRSMSRLWLFCLSGFSFGMGVLDCLAAPPRASGSGKSVVLKAAQGDPQDIRGIEDELSQVTHLCCKNPTETPYSASKFTCTTPVTEGTAACFSRFHQSFSAQAAEAYRAFAVRAPGDLRQQIGQECQGADLKTEVEQALCVSEVTAKWAQGNSKRESAVQAVKSWSHLEVLASHTGAQCLQLLQTRKVPQALKQAQLMGCLTSVPKPKGLDYDPSAGGYSSVPVEIAGLTEGARLNSEQEILFRFSSESKGGRKGLECPEYFPRSECSSGSAFDWVQNAKTAGASSASEDLLEGLYQNLLPDFQREVSTHLARLMVRKVKQRAVQLFGGNAREFLDTGVLSTLKQAGSCFLSSGANQFDWDTLPVGFERADVRDATQENYRRGVVHAAHCSKGIESRLKTLAHEIGRDLTVARPLVSPEEIEALPTLLRPVVEGVTALPVVRHLARDMKFGVGIRETANRNCSFQRIAMDPQIEIPGTRPAIKMSRREYCRNIFSEFALLSKELQDIHSSYPALATPIRERKSGPKGSSSPLLADEIVARSLGGLRQDAQGDHLDLNRSSLREVTSRNGSGLTSCLERFVEPDGRFREGEPELEDWAHREAISSFRDEVEIYQKLLVDLCKDPSELVNGALQSESLMQSYFDCSDPMVRESCGTRKDSSWVACRLFRQNSREQIQSEVLVQMFQLGSDLAFGFAPGISGVAAEANVLGAAVGVGAIAGGGLGLLFAPDNDPLLSDAQFRKAGYFLGHTPVGSDGTIPLDQELQRRESKMGNSQVESAISGAVQGAFFGLIGSRGTGSPRGKVSQADGKVIPSVQGPHPDLPSIFLKPAASQVTSPPPKVSSGSPRVIRVETLRASKGEVDYVIETIESGANQKPFFRVTEKSRDPNVSLSSPTEAIFQDAEGLDRYLNRVTAKKTSPPVYAPVKSPSVSRADPKQGYESLRVVPFDLQKSSMSVVSSPNGYTYLTTQRMKRSYSGGAPRMSLYTKILDSSEKNVGSIIREVEGDAATGFKIVFESAFASSEFTALPNGAPVTVSDYATLAQLKAAGITPGSIREVKGSTIVNQRTCIEVLLSLDPQTVLNYTPGSEAEIKRQIEAQLLQTHTSRYVQRILKATGNEVISAEIDISWWPPHSSSNLQGLLDRVDLSDPDPDAETLLLRKAKQKFCPTSDCSSVPFLSAFDITYRMKPSQ